MTSTEVRKKFLNFFEERGHKIIPSASLIPENDASVLFTTAGMQPLVPYLLGQKHPEGKRLANLQKCLRTTDIDDVGDNTHLTFFEMMGNWSLGDYFKEEAIKWSFELLTDKEKGFGLDPQRLYVTCFAGDNNAPKDTESALIWKSVGIPENRIYYLGADANWWPNVKGDRDDWTGPTGPSSEMFYDLTENGLGDLTHDEFMQADSEQKVVEIWNDVFMEYEKQNGKVVGKLKEKNVDTGAGFERVVTVLQNKKSVFETDLFVPILEVTKTLASTEKSQRIIADHIRASVFLIAEGVVASNTDRGYVLRRLIRRAIFNTQTKDLKESEIKILVESIITNLGSAYPIIIENRSKIENELFAETQKFTKTLKEGLKQFEKLESVSGKDAFNLFGTFGFPFEMTKELADEKGLKINEGAYEEEFKKHQESSRTATAGKFKGGLSGHSDIEVKYHTATHLLHKALKEILGDEVNQKGSNINPERLRFDFSYDRKMTDEEIEKVENWVNEQIKRSLPVNREETTLANAKAKGAVGLFEDKYGEMVSVYSIGDPNSGIISMELCGGPHVTNTGEIGKFKIKKEEAVSAGVRRIKAVIE